MEEHPTFKWVREEPTEDSGKNTEPHSLPSSQSKLPVSAPTETQHGEEANNQTFEWQREVEARSKASVAKMFLILLMTITVPTIVGSFLLGDGSTIDKLLVMVNSWVAGGIGAIGGYFLGQKKND